MQAATQPWAGEGRLPGGRGARTAGGASSSEGRQACQRPRYLKAQKKGQGVKAGKGSQ